jgi:hypothetical protein
MLSDDDLPPLPTVSTTTVTPNTNHGVYDLSQFPPGVIALLQQTIFAPTPIPTAGLSARGQWTQQEDDNLRSAVAHFGAQKWSEVARFVPTRTSKQCRERWFDRLAPDLKKGPFEPWEDHIVINKQREYGNKWAAIAGCLQGRSAASVKNRWYSGLKVAVETGSLCQFPSQSFDQNSSDHISIDL